MHVPIIIGDLLTHFPLLLLPKLQFIVQVLSECFNLVADEQYLDAYSSICYAATKVCKLNHQMARNLMFSLFSYSSNKLKTVQNDPELLSALLTSIAHAMWFYSDSLPSVQVKISKVLKILAQVLDEMEEPHEHVLAIAYTLVLVSVVYPRLVKPATITNYFGMICEQMQNATLDKVEIEISQQSLCKMTVYYIKLGLFTHTFVKKNFKIMVNALLNKPSERNQMDIAHTMIVVRELLGGSHLFNALCQKEMTAMQLARLKECFSKISFFNFCGLKQAKADLIIQFCDE